MKTILKNAKVILNDFIREGFVVIEDGRILSFESKAPDLGENPAREIDLKGMYLSPGFVDIHVHGGGDVDFLGGTPQTLMAAAKCHMQYGTTTISPTVSAFSMEEFKKSIDNYKSALASMTGGPNLGGIHFEAPYINPNQRGAFELKYIKNPDPGEYREVVDYADGAISRWTAAPELPGALEFGEFVSSHGILPTIGHSEAEYPTVERALECGYRLVTHLYSATSMVVRRGGFRYPGVVESAYLLDDLAVELIADGCHLPPEMLRMVYKIKGPDKICLVTDAFRFAGTGAAGKVPPRDGREQELIIEDGVVKLPDRSAFSGSIATADRLLRVMSKDAGVSLVDCIRMLCQTPARLIGIDGKTGSIRPGKDADLVVFDEGINIHGVMVKGNPVAGIFCV